MTDKDLHLSDVDGNQKGAFTLSMDNCTVASEIPLQWKELCSAFTSCTILAVTVIKWLFFSHVAQVFRIVDWEMVEEVAFMWLYCYEEMTQRLGTRRHSWKCNSFLNVEIFERQPPRGWNKLTSEESTCSLCHFWHQGFSCCNMPQCLEKTVSGSSLFNQQWHALC